ncbi:hypothetical protein EIP86_006795 [Pleurotus ostreatoroseus]|nr:hypothetical protein EIP86_006795 [Pleurotus ostreatoroseus]
MPVEVKAIVGLWLLGAQEGHNILETLHEKHSFSLQDEGGVVIMDGADKYIYVWFTVNYSGITTRDNIPMDAPTRAALCLRAASTQIVSAPPLMLARAGSPMH